MPLLEPSSLGPRENRSIHDTLNQKLAKGLESLGVESHPDVATVPVGWGSTGVEGVEGFIVSALLLGDDLSVSHSVRRHWITPTTGG